MGGRVRSGTGHHRRAVSDRVDRHAEQLDALAVGERWRLARRPAHDDTVRAVLDEERAELAVTLVVDRAVCVERCDGRSQYLAEHGSMLLLRLDSPP
jgi:hypothetical protein